jgi:Uma2 family endonuclease
MDATTRLLTADELLRLPDDGLRHELVAGELRTMAPTGNEHGWLTSDLHISLGSHVHSRGLGRVFAAETGFVLARNPDTVRAADVAFVRRERVEQVGRRPEYWPGPPDLAIEVVLPSGRPREVADKLDNWLRYGVRMVVAVYPRRRVVRVQRPGQPERVLTEAELLDGEDVVPGWTYPVRVLFAEEPSDPPPASPASPPRA